MRIGRRLLDSVAVLIAARTRHIRIGTAVFLTPLYHPLGLAG